MRFGYQLQHGKLLFQLVHTCCGVVLLGVLGLALMQHYGEAVLWGGVVVAIYRGVDWLLARGAD